MAASASENTKLNQMLKQISTLNEKFEILSFSLKEKQLADEKKWEEQDRKWAEMERRMQELRSKMKEEGRERVNGEKILQLKGNVESWYQMLDLVDDKFSKRLDEVKKETEIIKYQIQHQLLNPQKLEKEKNKVNTEIEKKVEVKAEVKVKEVEAEEEEEDDEDLVPVVENAFQPDDVYNRLIKPTVQHLRAVNSLYRADPDFTWLASDVNSMFSQSGKELQSATFNLRLHPFAARATLRLDDQKRVCFGITFKHHGDSQNTPFEITPIPHIVCTLKDRSKSRKDLIMKCYHLKSDKLSSDTPYFFVLPLDHNALLSPSYNAEGAITFDIHVEAPEMTRSAFSYNGNLTWAIDNYRMRKRMERAGLIDSYLSPYFYTSATQGFRVIVRAFLNGRSETLTGLTFEVALVNTAFDPKVTKNFPHRITLTLFHPLHTQRRISKSLENNISFVFANIIEMGRRSQVEELLHNDTLYYKVAIEHI